jgi:hypothetical protein
MITSDPNRYLDCPSYPVEWDEDVNRCGRYTCRRTIERLDVDVCPDHRADSLIPAVLDGTRRLSHVR